MTARSTAASLPSGQPAAVWAQRCLLLLLCVMPFHAFLSVWLGHLLGHETVWQSWKEVVLLISAGASLAAVWAQPQILRRLMRPSVYAALAFVLISLIVTAQFHPPKSAALFGVKTDLELVLAFIVSRLVATRRLWAQAETIILLTSGIVIAFGLLQIYVLPVDWLRHFGYGAATVVPYQTVDGDISSVRILSTMGGANQLGAFLIVPLSLAFWKALNRPRWWQAIFLTAGFIVMWHTYSRSAQLGLAAALVILAVVRLPRAMRLPALLAATIITAVGLQLATGEAGRSAWVQHYIFHQQLNNHGRLASTDLHALAVQEGLHRAEHHPLGEGLGAAGPASFHGPRGFIPENYYLQIAIEAGILGLIAFVAWQMLVGVELWRNRLKAVGAVALMAALGGVAAVNLFLHGWADSSLALVFWTAAGIASGDLS